MKRIKYQTLRCHNSEDHNIKRHFTLFCAGKTTIYKIPRYGSNLRNMSYISEGITRHILSGQRTHSISTSTDGSRFREETGQSYKQNRENRNSLFYCNMGASRGSKHEDGFFLNCNFRSLRSPNPNHKQHIHMSHARAYGLMTRFSNLNTNMSCMRYMFIRLHST
jgi:hypothetical protein